jgi:hypothetical protein
LPPPAFTEGGEAEPLVTLRGVLLMCIAFVLMLGRFWSPD